MLSSKSLKNGLLRILVILTVLDEEERGTRKKEERGGRSDEEEGATRRKEQPGGRSDEESEKMKKWPEDASWTPRSCSFYTSYSSSSFHFFFSFFSFLILFSSYSSFWAAAP